jgi:hypothetical protein
MRWQVNVIILGMCLPGAIHLWLSLRPNRISLALSREMQHGPGATVDLAAIAPFPWDRVHIFHPYTTHDTICNSLGFNWGDVGRTTTEWNEGVNLVVFVRNGEVVHWFEHSRREELADLAGSNGYARTQARFEVHPIGVEQRLALAPPKADK